MEELLEDIGRGRRDLESQHEAEHIGEQGEHGADDAIRVAVAEAEAKNEDENQINGHVTRGLVIADCI